MKFVIKDENQIEAQLGHGKMVISSDSDIGFRPVELLVSSVAGCSGSVFYSILKKQRLDFTEVTIDVEVERNKNEANRVVEMVLTFTVKGKQLNEKKLQRNLEITRRYCSMVRSVEESIDVVEKLTIVEE